MRLRRVDHLAWRTILDETLVLDLRRRMAFGLNEAGSRLLSWLERVRAVDRTFDRLPEELRDGVGAFLRRLEEERLVDVTPGDGSQEEGDPPVLEEIPRILWSEPLPRLAQQLSPPMEIGNVQCIQ